MNRLKELFDWDDLTEYQWSVRKPKNSKILGIFWLPIHAIWRPLGFYGTLLLISQWFPRICFWITFVSTIIIGILHLIGFLSSITLIELTNSFDRIKGSYHYAIWTSIGMIFLLTYSGSFLQNGFQPTQPALYQWLLLAADNFLSVVLLDFPEVFEFRLSTIIAVTWNAKLVVIMLRMLFALGLFELIINIFRIIFVRDRFVGSVRELYKEYSHMPDTVNLEIACIGKVEPKPISQRRPFSFREFMQCFAEDDLEYMKLKNYYLVKKSD